MNSQTFYALAGIAIGVIIIGNFLWDIDKERERERAFTELTNEYQELLDVYKATDAERQRLENSPCFVLGEAYTKNVKQLPYYPPVDIQEPLPYVE